MIFLQSCYGIWVIARCNVRALSPPALPPPPPTLFFSLPPRVCPQPFAETFEPTNYIGRTQPNALALVWR